LLNLCINARDAMPGGGELTIETANMHLDSGYVRVEAELTPGPYLMIAVTDTGSGMAPDVAARVFEPFFTTKEVGKGSGLGLSMVYGFIKQSGGHVRISTLAGHGTTVRLFLPRHRGDAPAIPQHEGSAIPSGLIGGGRVLLIAEDDALIRQFTTAALTRKGYRVVSSENGPSALDMLDRNPETVLLLTDVVLPGPMNGRQLAEEALRRHPGLKVLLTSGYTPDAAMHDDLREEELNLLRKPFSGRALIERVGAVLG
jgi:CheY-like chemotaxis protein